MESPGFQHEFQNARTPDLLGLSRGNYISLAVIHYKGSIIVNLYRQKEPPYTFLPSIILYL